MFWVRACSSNPWPRAASRSTEGKLSWDCLANEQDEADDGVEENEDDDEEEGGMAESLHSTCLSSTMPAAGMGATMAPGVTIVAAVVVMVTVALAVPPSFLVPADAWQ